MRRLATIGLMIFTPLSSVVGADNLLENPTMLPGTMVLEVATPERPVFRGTTSLPPGTTIALTLTKIRGWDYARYMAETATVVESGRFGTEQFTENSGDLKPGEYLVTLIATPPSPIATATAVGSDAENHNTQRVVLNGRLYRTLPHVEYKTALTISGPQSPAYAQSTCKQEYENAVQFRKTFGPQPSGPPKSVEDCIKREMSRGYFGR